MNQATNRIIWKLLTEKEKSGFDWSYQYKFFFKKSWNYYEPSKPHDEDIYRLKIEPEKWYYFEGERSGVVTGSDITAQDINMLKNLRPAKPSEIPKQEPTGKQLVGLLCRVCDSGDVVEYAKIEEVEGILEATCEYETKSGTDYDCAKPLSIADLEDYLEKAKKAGVE
ncbi:MAG: hypothetical protein V3U78_05400 [Thiotrichaceae bacterium]